MKHFSLHRGEVKHTCFTLIELLVSTVISSWHFVTRSAGCEKTRPSVFVSLRRDESLRWGSDISSQRSPLFIRRYYRNLSDYTDSAHAVCLSYFDCCCKASNQTVRDAARLNSRRREGVAGDFPPPQVPAVVQV